MRRINQTISELKKKLKMAEYISTLLNKRKKFFLT